MGTRIRNNESLEFLEFICVGRKKNFTSLKHIWQFLVNIKNIYINSLIYYINKIKNDIILNQNIMSLTIHMISKSSLQFFSINKYQNKKLHHT